MSTSLRSETEVLTFLEQALENEIGCEISWHPSNKATHDEGGATWILVTDCNNCGENTTLLCNKFCNLLISSLTDDTLGKSNLRCAGCGYERGLPEAYKNHFKWG